VSRDRIHDKRAKWMSATPNEYTDGGSLANESPPPRDSIRQRAAGSHKLREHPNTGGCRLAQLDGGISLFRMCLPCREETGDERPDT